MLMCECASKLFQELPHNADTVWGAPPVDVAILRRLEDDALWWSQYGDIIRGDVFSVVEVPFVSADRVSRLCDEYSDTMV